jgi:hypothetical protein
MSYFVPFGSDPDTMPKTPPKGPANSGYFRCVLEPENFVRTSLPPMNAAITGEIKRYRSLDVDNLMIIV